MTQITKKEFIETLSNNETILVDSLFRYNDRKCINAMEHAMERIITINKNVKRRTVAEEHKNIVIISCLVMVVALALIRLERKNISVTQIHMVFIS
ncbi:hypothetical protein [Ruminococcus bromii]|uniref:hypothetical protein n=1 Tax=Ruminococcus bromii TaxID=40518 RepID=UPI003FD85CCE